MTPLRYLRNLVVVLDIGVNVVLLASHDIETLSRRAARAQHKRKRWGCILCAALDRIDRGHCAKALEVPPI